MLKDVIELRQTGWVSRRVQDAPKTIHEIHEDAKKEQIQMEMAHQQADRKRGSSRSGELRRRSFYAQIETLALSLALSLPPFGALSRALALSLSQALFFWPSLSLSLPLELSLSLRLSFSGPLSLPPSL